MSKFLFPWPAEYLLMPNSLEYKVPHRQELDLLAFNELCGSCPWKWWRALTFQRNIFCPSISQDHLEISTDPPCPKAQLNETSSHHWKPCLASKDASSDSILFITGVLLMVTWIDGRKFPLYQPSTLPSSPAPCSLIPVFSAHVLSIHPFTPSHNSDPSPFPVTTYL